MFRWPVLFALWLASSIAMIPTRLARIPPREWGWITFWFVLIAVGVYAIWWPR